MIVPVPSFESKLDSWSKSVRLAIELILALYVISFVWFWTLCRVSSPKDEDATHNQSPSNVIPFERGLHLQERKRTGT